MQSNNKEMEGKKDESGVEKQVQKWGDKGIRRKPMEEEGTVASFYPEEGSLPRREREKH
jgi:hypothetical protein